MGPNHPASGRSTIFAITARRPRGAADAFLIVAITCDNWRHADGWVVSANRLSKILAMHSAAAADA
jgi:hypothetical protein